MINYKIVTLREKPKLKHEAAKWFSDKWGIDKETYLECINNYINSKTEYGWYIALYEDNIIGGLGVIDNDFHDRKDLYPNVCAVYVEERYRNNGIAGKLLDYVVLDMKNKGISPLYLFTDHINFYEKYGWEFYCMAKNDGSTDLSRIYIHK